VRSAPGVGAGICQKAWQGSLLIIPNSFKEK
jgi:hypothetical protein